MTKLVNCAAILACFLCTAANATTLAAAEGESLDQLRQDKVKAAQQWWDAVTNTLHGSLDFGVCFAPSRALKDAQFEIAADKKARVRALQAYCDRNLEVFEKVSALYNVNAKGGEPERYAEARYHLLEAKILLKEEEAKP